MGLAKGSDERHPTSLIPFDPPRSLVTNAPEIKPLREPTIDVDALALAVAEACWERKAHNVRVIDVRGIASYADYLVICHGTSERHASTIADFVVEDLRPLKIRPKGREGFRSGDWLLVDFADVVLHVFADDARAHYALESLWSDAPRVEIEAPEGTEFPEEEVFRG
ncbi:MAG: ribosome-associated protein [Bradymonadia bacterium]